MATKIIYRPGTASIQNGTAGRSGSLQYSINTTEIALTGASYSGYFYISGLDFTGMKYLYIKAYCNTHYVDDAMASKVGYGSSYGNFAASKVLSGNQSHIFDISNVIEPQVVSIERAGDSIVNIYQMYLTTREPCTATIQGNGLGTDYWGTSLSSVKVGGVSYTLADTALFMPGEEVTISLHEGTNASGKAYVTINGNRVATSTSYTFTANTDCTINVGTSGSGASQYTFAQITVADPKPEAPDFYRQPKSASYILKDSPAALTVGVEVVNGTLAVQWQKSTDKTIWSDIAGATAQSYTPSIPNVGVTYYRLKAINNVNGATAESYSDTVSITVVAPDTPTFTTQPKGGAYVLGGNSLDMTVAATVADGGIISYQWQKQGSDNIWANIAGATASSYKPPTGTAGEQYYRVVATNRLHNATASATSDTATIIIRAAGIGGGTSNPGYETYIEAVKRPFIKIARLRFLQPDGSTAFAVDSNPKLKRNKAFIDDGSISVNLQNGRRRSATVNLVNIGEEFDYNVNQIWFGDEIALDEGIMFADGTEFYIQQGVFLAETPTETLNPGDKRMTYNLVDKWANLDGTLFGRLEGTYEVARGTNIFEPIKAILDLDRGNGRPVDNTPPVFTEYYNGKTQELTDGTSASLTDSPYTLTVDGDGTSYSNVVLGLALMVNAWVGYDSTGTLRLDPSQDDILDTTKPVLWQFSQDKAQLLGLSYTIKNTEVYNDYIVIGEQLDDYSQPSGRAQNLDPTSDTNINLIGRKTIRVKGSQYATDKQCQDLAEWKLKRATVLQKAVTISCSQLLHIKENDLVTIVRTDKPGSPVERHLIQGFSRPLTGTGPMTINAVSVNDFPIATLTSWPDIEVDPVTLQIIGTGFNTRTVYLSIDGKNYTTAQTLSLTPNTTVSIVVLAAATENYQVRINLYGTQSTLQQAGTKDFTLMKNSTIQCINNWNGYSVTVAEAT